MLNKIKNLLKLFNFNINFTEILNFLGEFKIDKLKKSIILFWFICAFTIIIVIWAAFAEIDQVVRANGEVNPESEVHLIQNSIAGPIELISVKLGDRVKKGDTLFHIAKSQNDLIYQTTLNEVDTRKKKVQLLQDLVNSGSEAEMVLLNEKLQLIDSERRLSNALINKDFSKIRSPVDGTVSLVEAKNIGQFFRSGETLAEIVPDNPNLRLKAYIPTKDISNVESGMSAQIAFTSYDMAIYGQFEGYVKTVSEATVNIGQDATPFYEAIIEVVDSKLTTNTDINIKSGMQASVSIIGDKRTILSYVFNPITKLSKTALRE